MGFIKEPKGVDFTVESKVWTEEDKELMRRVIAKSKRSKATGKGQSRLPLHSA